MVRFDFLQIITVRHVARHDTMRAGQRVLLFKSLAVQLTLRPVSLCVVLHLLSKIKRWWKMMMMMMMMIMTFFAVDVHQTSMQTAISRNLNLFGHICWMDDNCLVKSVTSGVDKHVTLASERIVNGVRWCYWLVPWEQHSDTCSRRSRSQVLERDRQSCIA